MSGPASVLLRGAPSLPARPWARHRLDPGTWREMVQVLHREPSLALIGLWAAQNEIFALFLDEARAQPLLISVATEAGFYLALSPIRPGAALFERMIADLWGFQAAGSIDTRPLFDHETWTQHYPLSTRPIPAASLASRDVASGHLSLGPIWSDGTEPRRLSLNATKGKIRQADCQLGDTHRGIVKAICGQDIHHAAFLIGRISATAAIAHELAFARAVEAALTVQPSPRSRAVRRILLDIERIALHLLDLERNLLAIGAALAEDLAVLHEDWRRICQQAFERRLPRGLIVPGGCLLDPDLTTTSIACLLNALSAFSGSFAGLQQRILRSSIPARLHAMGIIDPEIAARMGAGGIIGRASRRAFDTRRLPGLNDPGLGDKEMRDLDDTPARTQIHRGDAESRMRLRLTEILGGVARLRHQLNALPDGKLLSTMPDGTGEGVGVAEAGHGDVWCWVAVDHGVIVSCFPRDPAWMHWALLSHALMGEPEDEIAVVATSLGLSVRGIDL